MTKHYLAKIIAKDHQGLQMISAYCAEAKVNIQEEKYINKNKIFLISLERFSLETEKKKIINIINNFEFIDNVKSKNINQNDKNLVLDLIGIDILKNKDKYEINLIFSKNAHIILSTEIIEVTLEDQY